MQPTILVSLVLGSSLALSGGCVASDSDPTPTELVVDQGKADGQGGTSFTLTPLTPPENFFFDCDEWFSCDVDLRVTGSGRGLFQLALAHFAANPTATELRIPKAYTVRVVSGIHTEHVDVPLCATNSAEDLRFVTCDDEQPEPLSLRHAFQFSDADAHVEIDVAITQELADFAKAYDVDYSLEGRIYATWR